jgi:hypothetical protein
MSQRIRIGDVNHEALAEIIIDHARSEAARKHGNARFGVGDRDARVSADGGEHGLPLGWCRCDAPTIRHEPPGKPISQTVGGIAETRASIEVQYRNRPNRPNRVNFFRPTGSLKPPCSPKS